MTGNHPYTRLPEVPSFTVTSATEGVAHGDRLPDAQLFGLFGMPGGLDRSPQLSWSGAPEGTKGYAVTMFDPDAPTQSGFWHWIVANIPADVTELPEGAGDETGSGLPVGAFQLRSDSGAARFIGAAPPAGHGEHRYFITVHALDTADLGVPADAPPALFAFTMTSHILARATMVATFETAGDDRAV